MTRSSADANDRYTFTIRGDAAGRFDQAFDVTSGKTVGVYYAGGHPRLQPLVAALHVLVICNAKTCIVADAFVPSF